MRTYKREWIAKRRADYFEGKACVKCGSVVKLELDHIDPTLKVHDAIWSWSRERREAELAKCQVLCHDCHLNKTAMDREWQQGHGTRDNYRDGCRCGPCREAHSAYMKAWRRRTGYSGTVARERARQKQMVQ